MCWSQHTRFQPRYDTTLGQGIVNWFSVLVLAIIPQQRVYGTGIEDEGVFITSIFDTSNALYEAARILFQSTAQNVMDRPNAILLPGGTTPRPLFQHIQENPFPVPDCFFIGYTDERHVPPDDSASNYGMTLDMLQALDVSPEHVVRVDTLLSLNDAADQYDLSWRTFFDMGGTIPLAFVGLGTDGHTCSLFSEEQVRTCPANRFAIPVVRDNGPDRVTVTPMLLSRIKHVIILVTDTEKAEVIEAITKSPEGVIAGMALAGCPRVSIWYASHA